MAGRNDEVRGPSDSAASRPAKGEIYDLSQIVQAAQKLLRQRPQTRIFTTTVNSKKDVDDRIGVNGDVAQVPLVDVQFVEDRASQWYFDGEIVHIVGDLYDGRNRVGGEIFETKEGRARLAEIIVETMDPWLRSVLGHFSVKSGVQRGDNLIANVSLSIIDKQEEAFGELVDALQQADSQVSLHMTRSAIAGSARSPRPRPGGGGDPASAEAREARPRLRGALETPGGEP